MAAFVRKFYTHKTVAANDIGAISFYNNVRLIDLWGLASKDVAAKILSGSYDTEALRDLAAQTKPRIIILYESRFQGHNGPSIPGERGHNGPSIPGERGHNGPSIPGERGRTCPSIPGEWGRTCPSIPGEWTKVGAWRISGNVVCVSDKVTFYVSDDLEKERALECLKEFSCDLPHGVTQEGLYLSTHVPPAY